MRKKELKYEELNRLKKKKREDYTLIRKPCAENCEDEHNSFYIRWNGRSKGITRKSG